MISRIIFLLMCCSMSSTLLAQINLNQIGHLSYTRELSDVWGYTDSTGHEYALVGVENGFSIVDVDTPSNPQQLHFVPGSNTSWRDIKVWNHYAYVISEGNDQLLIVDLSQLPGSIQTWTRSPLGMTSAHNIFIDENGVGYIVGADVGVGGAIMIDCDANPSNPPVLANYDQYYIHDVFVRGDTMWAGMINNGFIGIVDVSVPGAVNSPGALMGIQTTPNNFSHNVWVSDDGDYMFTTDERSDAYIAAYDVKRLNNISEVDRIQSSPGQNVIPHNTFYLDGFLVTSYYRDGIVVHDAKVPQKLVETGNFDTSPNFSGNGFNGAWGVYPYLPSGRILATDIEEGLYVLGPTFQEAARVTGIVRDSLCGSRLSNVEVQIVSGNSIENTDITGLYWLGQLDTGVYDIQFSRAGYQTLTVSNVHLQSGVIDTLNVRMVPLNTVDLNIWVFDSASGQPIPNANIRFSQGGFVTHLLSTNALGKVRDCTFPADVYDIHWGKWSFKTQFTPGQFIQGPTHNDTLYLPFGYYDDFIFDFAWTDSNEASTGLWTRGVPDGTTYFGDECNPGADVNGDFGEEAYVSGNNGGNAGDDDIDDGGIWLRSPEIDLDRYNDPIIDFEYWFFNEGGSGTPNDIIEFALLDSAGNRVLLGSTTQSQDLWRSFTIRLKSVLPPQGKYRFEVYSTDDAPGHLVEAGLDYFRMREWQHPDCAEILVGSADTFFMGTGPCAVFFDPLSNDLFHNQDSISYSIIQTPSVGTLIDSGSGSLFFYANTNADTTDAFSYIICNNCPSCDTVNVQVQISQGLACDANSAPFFNNGQNQALEFDQRSSPENSIDTFCLRPYDPDGDSVSHRSLGATGSGMVQRVSDSCYAYFPAQDFVGIDSFRVEICDFGFPPLCDTLLIEVTKLDTVEVGGIYTISSSINLFPNPGKSGFTIHFDELVSAKLEIRDAMGRLVSASRLNQTSEWHSADLSELPSGIYVISVTSEDQTYQRTWLKE